MPLTKTFPTKDIPTAGGNIPSEWWAAHNPLLVRVQRKDFPIASSVSHAAGAKTKVNITGSLPAMAAGDYIYINVAAEIPVGLYQLDANVTLGDTFFIINLAFTADCGTGFVNLVTAYANYYIEAKYEKYNIATSTWASFGAITRHRADTTGLSKIDINATLKNSVTMQDDVSNHSGFVNVYDTNLSSICGVFFREVYNGVAGAWDGGSQVSLTDSAIQAGNPNGSNLKEFVTEGSGTTMANFVSDFIRPTYFEGYPFDIGFIYSSSLFADVGALTVRRVEDRAIDDDNITEDAIDTTQALLQNRMLLSGGFTTDKIKVYLAAKFIP